MVIHYKRNNSLGIGMPMYNKGCDCLEIALLFVFEVRYPLPTSLQLGHARVLSSLALRLFHTPLSSFQTQIAKQSSDADPISYYSLLAGLWSVADIPSITPRVRIPAFPLSFPLKSAGVQKLLWKY